MRHQPRQTRFPAVVQGVERESEARAVDGHEDVVGLPAGAEGLHGVGGGAGESGVLEGWVDDAVVETPAIGRWG